MALNKIRPGVGRAIEGFPSWAIHHYPIRLGVSAGPRIADAAVAGVQSMPCSIGGIISVILA